MRRLLLIFLLLNVLEIHAQTDSLTVHVAGRPLADLLTDEQKQKVNYLFITGTLADEDYAFLRGNNLPKLHELNLRKADIDTIPKKAFYEWGFRYNYLIGNKRYSGGGLIVLPERLIYISDSVFYDSSMALILTGIFPKRGFGAFEGYIALNISKDNPYCKTDKNYGNGIFSKDGKILYCSRYNEMPEGLETIEERAFEGGSFDKLVFPKTIKEIKNYAFYDCDLLACNCNNEFYAELVFQTETPPILGEKAFNRGKGNYFNDAILYVPEGCYENYINADEQWKIFKKDRSETSIKPSMTENLHIRRTSIGWQISCESPIRRIQLYNVSGVLINQTLLKGATEHLIPYPVVVTPCIMRVLLDDGNEFTVKL